MTSVSIIATYAVRENYGAHDWDGVGACPQYWKNKGSTEKVLREGLSVADVLALTEGGTQHIDKLALGEQEFDEGYQLSLYGWSFIYLDEELIARVKAALVKQLGDEWPDYYYVKYNWDNEYAFEWAAQELVKRGELWIAEGMRGDYKLLSQE